MRKRDEARWDTYEINCAETSGDSSTQDSDIAEGARNVPQDGTENNHVSQVRTHGPFVNFVSQADDYEYCLPSIVLLFGIVIYVRAGEMGVKPADGGCKEGYERLGSRAIVEESPVGL